MSAITFDTLKFVETLKMHGMHEEQAKGVAEAFKDAQGEAELAIRRDIDNARRDMHEMESNLRRDMRKMEQRMIIKLGGLMVVAVGVVATLVKPL